jgi:hypothetical protein
MSRRSSRASSDGLKQKALIAVALVGGLAVGGAATYVGFETGGVSADRAGDIAAETLSNATGQSYEVVNVERNAGLYEVQLSSNDQLLTYYVTQDGGLLTGSMTDVSQLQETAARQSDVSSCLNEKGAVMYGNLSQRPTQLQIQVLGGADEVSGFYRDVSAPNNQRQAISSGVTSVPAIVLDNRTLTDVNNIEQVSSFANCGE